MTPAKGNAAPALARPKTRRRRQRWLAFEGLSREELEVQHHLAYVDLLLAKLEEDGVLDLVEAELARRRRIAAGLERGCQNCGCSETRACLGGCIWVDQNVCSRCAK
ncbi:MAG TPA: hypothetical protein VKT49_18670 [Bryobacteraceae bacterium]|nr:hypothetical protein [Bryobacteraceae bacterium]